jgi:hypothetical protein
LLVDRLGRVRSEALTVKDLDNVLVLLFIGVFFFRANYFISKPIFFELRSRNFVLR